MSFTSSFSKSNNQRLKYFIFSVVFFSLVPIKVICQRGAAPEIISVENNGAGVAFVKNLKYGIFSHYVWSGSGTADINGFPAKTIKAQLDDFDVSEYAKDCKNFGAQYVVFTAWHAGMNPLYNSPVYRKWRSVVANNPGAADRDILSELADALHKEHIDLFLYTHPNDLHDFSEGDKKLFDYKYQGDTTFNYKLWNDYLGEMYAEITKRYKGKIKGFWLDEGLESVSNDHFVDYKRLLKTIKSVDSSIFLIQNYWHAAPGKGKYLCNTGMKEFQIHSNWSDDYWQHGLAALRSNAGTWPSFGYSSLAYVEENIQTKDNPNVLLKARDIVRYTVYQSASNKEGLGACWCINPLRGLHTSDIWAKGVKSEMEKAGLLIKRIKYSLFNTRPSTSWPAKVDVDPDIPFIKKGDLGTTPYVVMQSSDGTKEFIHVLNPGNESITKNILRLPKPLDNKVFKKARLLMSNTEVSLKIEKDGTLGIMFPTNFKWDELDTVIILM